MKKLAALLILLPALAGADILIITGVNEKDNFPPFNTYNIPYGGRTQTLIKGLREGEITKIEWFISEPESVGDMYSFEIFLGFNNLFFESFFFFAEKSVYRTFFLVRHSCP